MDKAQLEVMRACQQARHDVMTGKTPFFVHESYFVIDGENAASRLLSMEL